MKTCPECKKEKDRSAWYRSKSSSTGYESICKSCKKAREKIRKSNACPKHKRDVDLQWRYGISLDNWQDMFTKQNGCCAICKTHQSELKSSLHVDHNHNTGKVRGLLCSNCNTAIGLLKDDEDRLLSAIQYIRRTSN